MVDLLESLYILEGYTLKSMYLLAPLNSSVTNNIKIVYWTVFPIALEYKIFGDVIYISILCLLLVDKTFQTDKEHLTSFNMES